MNPNFILAQLESDGTFICCTKDAGVNTVGNDRLDRGCEQAESSISRRFMFILLTDK